MWQQKQIFLASILFKKWGRRRVGGGGLSESGRIFEKNIPGNSEMMNPHSMFYNLIGEEILFTALIYLRSSWAGKNTRQLVKYSSVLYFKPTKNVYVYIRYDMIYIWWNRNLIEIPGRGVKIFKLPLDHEPSYEDITYCGKLLCSTWSIAVLIYIGKTVYLQCILPYRCNYENH